MLTEEELQRAIYVVKKSREEIGEPRFSELSKEVDEDIKKLLGEEKWLVYEAAQGSQEMEDNLIAEIGKEKYSAFLDEINEILLNQIDDKYKEESK